MMDSVTLENFRCFRERQTVRLAPLTLLVGENSTGKTSFLAMLRILAQLQEGETSIDFKEPPYDLGSFDDIAHNRGRGEGTEHASEFTIGFEHCTRSAPPRQSRTYRSAFTFRKHGSAPQLFKRSLSVDGVAVEEELTVDRQYRAVLQNDAGAWTLDAQLRQHDRAPFGHYRILMNQLTRLARFDRDGDNLPRLVSIDGESKWDDNYAEQFLRVVRAPHIPRFRSGGTFASAPVRSKPRRTYDPARLDPDPEGDYVPMYLADLAAQPKSGWGTLKTRLDKFGQESGLFDELLIRPLGQLGSGDPFQIEVRKGGGQKDGAKRNLTDVGYGVSQVLPIVTELLASSAPTDLYLFQQPEVHLHPSAQAVLGSLLCNVAADGSQLIVETHSDHLIDRVRMDVRDGKTNLTPDDVRILYFERGGLDVKIHELWWDKIGNIENAPQGYRSFFMEEVERSIWPPS